MRELSNARIGRNDPCPCGSGKKYKRCCLESRAPHFHTHRCVDCGKEFECSEALLLFEEFDSLSDAEIAELAEHVSTLRIVGTF